MNDTDIRELQQQIDLILEHIGLKLMWNVDSDSYIIE